MWMDLLLILVCTLPAVIPLIVTRTTGPARTESHNA